MAMTLTEYAKSNPGNVISNAYIEMYAGSSAILERLPFLNIAGNALKYNREGKLPGVGFRGVNESYTPSTGILNPLTESLVIAGGDLDVDKFILDTMGPERRSIEEAAKVRALGLSWTAKFIKGDTASDPREFDGLQVRIVGDQKIAAGATANGTALSLFVLDGAIDQTMNPTHMIMNKKMARRFTQAARSSTVGGNINFTVNQFGDRVMDYNGLPILTLDLDNEENQIITNTEACTSGTATGTSIYIVSFGEDMLTGIQNGTISVRDLGELQEKPAMRTRVEWYPGIACFNGRAATRLWSIADSAIVA